MGPPQPEILMLLLEEFWDVKDLRLGMHLLRIYPSEARFMVSSRIIARCSHTNLTNLERVSLPVRSWGLSSEFSWRFEDFGDIPEFCQCTQIRTGGDIIPYT